MITTNSFKASKIVAWLKTQPLERKFSYFHCEGCLFSSYAKECLGAKIASAGGDYIFVDGKRVELPVDEYKAASHIPTTFTVAQALEEFGKLEITTDSFKAGNVIAWLKTQPATRKFDYFDLDACLFASFAKENLGAESVCCGGDHIDANGDRYLLPEAEYEAIGNLSKVNHVFTAARAIEVLGEI